MKVRMCCMMLTLCFGIADAAFAKAPEKPVEDKKVKPLKELIVGKWKAFHETYQEGGEVVFKSDGSANFTDSKRTTEPAMKVTWKAVGKDRIHITMTADSGSTHTMTWNVAVKSSDKLFITRSDDKKYKVTLTRIK